jgi:hypothetical protein
MCGARLLRKFPESGSEFIGLKSKRPGLALIDHTAMGVDEIDAIRPSGISAFGGVTELIEDRRKFDSKFAHTGVGHKAALVFVPGTGEDDFVLDVALHLPHVARVRFENVDDEEGDAMAVLIEELVEGGNLPPERRSSVTAEDEHNRLLGSE